MSDVLQPKWPYLFLTVSGLGLCGKVGRRATTIISESYKRRLGDKHKPLATLFIPLLEEAKSLAHWPTPEDITADLELIKRWAQEQIDGEKEAAEATRAKR